MESSSWLTRRALEGRLYCLEDACLGVGVGLSCVLSHNGTWDSVGTRETSRPDLLATSTIVSMPPPVSRSPMLRVAPYLELSATWLLAFPTDTSRQRG
jgi:hypothetical protein